MLMRGGCVRTGLWSTIDACRCVRYIVGRRCLGCSVLLFIGIAYRCGIIFRGAVGGMVLFIGIAYRCGIMILRGAVGVMILIALPIIGNLSGRVILSFVFVDAGSCSVRVMIILCGVISFVRIPGAICRGFIIFYRCGCEIKFVRIMINTVVVLRSGGALRPRGFQPRDCGSAKWTTLVRSEPLSDAVKVHGFTAAECGNVGLLIKANDTVTLGCALSCVASGPRFGFLRRKICLIRLFSPELRKCSGQSICYQTNNR